MKESVGYTVTLNIVIMFIVVVFAFLAAALIYYKSNKVNNAIINSIEKYEGFNDLAVAEIERNMISIGYNKHSINCGSSTSNGCSLVNENKSKKNGYCVYLCTEKSGESTPYYYFRVKSFMMINVPIINEILNIPIYSNTNRLYNFGGNQF